MTELPFIAPGLRFPLVLDQQGAVAVADAGTTVRQMILQILFTSPGERVARPDFGVGVRDLVFEPNTDFLASRVRRRLSANLARYLGDQVELQGVGVESVTIDEPMLVISIRYAIRGAIEGTQELQVAFPRLAP